jgi:hypothetical protein
MSIGAGQSLTTATSSLNGCSVEMSQVSNWQTVQNPVAGNLINGNTWMSINSDLGQPYIDLASLRYGSSQDCVFFQFNLRGKLPLMTEPPASVKAIWYQVLIAVGQSSANKFQWSNTFTPDHMLNWEMDYGPGNQPDFSVMRYSGTGTDWNWTPVGGTEQVGANVTLQGGIGLDFFVIASRYVDLGATRQSTLEFFGRSGIRVNNGTVYNDYVPSSGILGMTPIPEFSSSPLVMTLAILTGLVFARVRTKNKHD